MIALVFEAYSALCLFAFVVFLAWAAVAKSRPDLDEAAAIIEEPSWPPAGCTVSKRPIRRRPHMFHTRKPHTI